MESLYRPEKGRIIAGVASGIARATGINVWVIRFLFVIGTFGGFFPGVVFYGLAWLFMPSESRLHSISR